ncbi:MAG TPA: hypothetical protein VHC63_04425 [Acidimicrobiales bacterium]|nr:hypothetical protein [Acidimicrobiales bacterium]
MRRIIVTVVIAASFLMAGASPAFAHTVAGTGATNYKTTLTRVSPTLPGLHIKVIEAGSRVEVRYTGTKTIYVLGYVDEQYLRIDKRGVFQNLNSPATYINKTRQGTTNPPADVDPRKQPVWHKVASGQVARWHDHRIHFMGGINPLPIRQHPGERHVVQDDWQIKVTDLTTTAIAHGSLVWVPGPSPAPMLLLALVLLVVVIGVSLLVAPFVPVLLATAALVVIDIVHSLAIGFANAGGLGVHIAQTFASSIVSIPAWAVGALGVWLLARKRVDGFFAAVFCGLIVAVVGGLADFSVLSRSQVPFALSAAVARPIVAASFGLGVGIAVASGLGIRRLDPRPTSEESPAPQTSR